MKILNMNRPLTERSSTDLKPRKMIMFYSDILKINIKIIPMIHGQDGILNL